MKRLLNIGDGAAVTQAFDRFDVGAVGLNREHEAGVHRQAVQ